MILEDKQLVESIVAEGDANREAGDWGAAKMSFVKALDEFRRLEAELETSSHVSDEDKTLLASITEKIAEVDVKLAAKHREMGIASLESKDYERAIDELDEAINLASEKDVAFLEDVKKLLDRARLKDRDEKMYEDITPFVSRGDDFKKAGNFAEAILEYQEALKLMTGFPAEHRFLIYIHEVLQDCRRNLVRPYLTNIYRAASQGKNKKAFQIIQRVLILVDEDDLVYRAFLEQLKEDIGSRLAKEDVEEDEANPETWTKAIDDYEEALNLYSSYSVSDPLSPAYTSGNVYEDRFLKTRRNLAALYRKRAEKLRDSADIRKAIRNFKEALKLFPRGDRAFRETFHEIKRLRAQLSAKEA